MSHHRKAVGVTLATAAAALFLSGAAMTAAPNQAQAADGVKCMGINSCKGHGECKTANNECKGLNGCKGKGWITVGTAEECADKGGTLKK